MAKALWACCLCGKDFTRKFSAYRHREKVDSGKSVAVRFVEYLAGQASGLYSPPIIPPRLSGNRRQRFLRAKTDGQISSSYSKADKTVADSTHGILWSHNNPSDSSLQDKPKDENISTLSPKSNSYSKVVGLRGEHIAQNA